MPVRYLDGQSGSGRPLFGLGIDDGNARRVIWCHDLDKDSFMRLADDFAEDGPKVIALAEGLLRALDGYRVRERIVQRPTDLSMWREFEKLRKQIERIVEFAASKNLSFYKSAIDRNPPRSQEGSQPTPEELALLKRDRAITGRPMEEFEHWIAQSGKMLEVVTTATEKQAAWAKKVAKSGGSGKIKSALSPMDYLIGMALPELFASVTGEAFVISRDTEHTLRANAGTKFVERAATTMGFEPPSLSVIQKHYYACK